MAKIDSSKLIQIIASVFIPPLGVFLGEGTGKNLVINILLTLLGFFPGVLHALYLALKK